MKKEALDVEVLDSKLFKKVAKHMGDNNAKEFIQKTNEELRAAIATDTMAIELARAETEANSDYQKACAIRADFRSALKEATDPHKLKVNLASYVLRLRKG
jgi:hypothetical protein